MECPLGEDSATEVKSSTRKFFFVMILVKMVIDLWREMELYGMPLFFYEWPLRDGNRLIRLPFGGVCFNLRGKGTEPPIETLTTTTVMLVFSVEGHQRAELRMCKVIKFNERLAHAIVAPWKIFPDCASDIGVEVFVFDGEEGEEVEHIPCLLLIILRATHDNEREPVRCSRLFLDVNAMIGWRCVTLSEEERPCRQCGQWRIR